MQALANNFAKIKSEEKSIDCQQDSNVWVFNKDVQINGNNGGVIPEEEQEHIFDESRWKEISSLRKSVYQ